MVARIVLSLLMIAMAPIAWADSTPAENLNGILNQMPGIYAPSQYIFGDKAVDELPPVFKPMTLSKMKTAGRFRIEDENSSVVLSIIDDEKMRMTQFLRYKNDQFVISRILGTISGNEIFFDEDTLEYINGEAPDNNPKFAEFVKINTGIELIESDKMNNLAYTFDHETKIFSANTVVTRPVSEFVTVPDDAVIADNGEVELFKITVIFEKMD